MQQMSDSCSNKCQTALDDSGNLAQMNSCMELEIHANMPIVGKQCFILAETGKTVDVNPFTPKYKALTARLVDTALQ